MKIAAIVQARTGSTRLPNKVFAELIDKPLIWHVFNRIKFSNKINEFVLATTTDDSDDLLQKWALENNIKCYRGNETDVLERFYFAAKGECVQYVLATDIYNQSNLKSTNIS